MANYSDCSIEIFPKNRIEETIVMLAFKGIEVNHNYYSYDNYYSYKDNGTVVSGEISFVDNNYSIYASIVGRWSGPLCFFTELMEKFNLTGIYIDSEPGNDFFQKVSYENGLVTEEISTRYISSESIDEYGEDWFISQLDYYDLEELEDVENYDIYGRLRPEHKLIIKEYINEGKK